MKRERNEGSIERIIGRGCDTSRHLFRGRERERVRREDEAKQRAEGTEGDEWVDSAIEQMRCFSNIQRDEKWERVCRCGGSGRQRERGGDQER